MSISQEYKRIYAEEIISKCKGVIFRYSPVKNKYDFLPFSHGVSGDAVEKLAELMRKNLLFYCYGEEEVVSDYARNKFSSLEQAAKYAFVHRLPDRAHTSDGLPSEVLLDLLIQITEPTAYKLAVRPLFRQDDNNEIKGYDLTYFSTQNDEVSLWLGQAKMGTKEYCKGSINEDLLEKFKKVYLARQMFFICDKPAELTEEAKSLIRIINDIDVATLEEDPTQRADTLLRCFRDNNIKIRIPCLLAYGEGLVYENPAAVFTMIEQETESIQKYYLSHKYEFEGFTPEILFYIFPIQDLDRVRNKETGFYAGLY